MHWIDRGDSPDGLGEIREIYTPRWISHYRDGSDTKPTDSHWRAFHDALGERFYYLCAYCEDRTDGEVDHFRPKSRFPELVYEWSNWLFACNSCNRAKGDKWPDSGYVNPCSDSAEEHPENYFDFDTGTGEVIPRIGLSPDRRRRAIDTIEDLRLNSRRIVDDRLSWIRMVREAVADRLDSDSPGVSEFCDFLTERSTEWSSLSRAYLAERGYPTSG